MKIFTERSSKFLIWTGITLIILALISFQFGEKLFDFSNQIKSDKVGQLGDFIGGVIGSIWALAGVILFYAALNKQSEALEDQKAATTAAIKSLNIQSTELQLQREELSATRKEFLMNRTTNIVFHQLERFEKSIKELSLSRSTGTIVEGSEAIYYLDETIEKVHPGTYTDDKEYKAELKQATIKNLKIYTRNISSLETFSNGIYNSTEVIKRLIFKTNLEIQEINDIKNLFFVNIGFVTMGVIEQISDDLNNKLTYLKGQDYIANDLFVSDLINSEIFLSSIKEFYNLSLTETNFEEEKKKWISNQGSHFR
ncbi:hypothetical protein [uncultured Dokdonia sp.]|uniref:hypothetical protein n=1 Tax=uncultured Dokdonia sp. TaxID=575653 RepID=UPI00260E9B13|nr:hypothetical protein [uncultured Dokdonia sp.]